MKVAIIPARGGSTRIPRKNIRPFFGKPIMAYSIETAKRSGLFDEVYVSTEDDEIGQIARKYGAALIHRPPELAEIGAPDCGTQEVTRHAINVLQGHSQQIDYACCIYPCAPLLDPIDLRQGWWEAQNRPYAYVKGLFYWGHADCFVEGRPLTSGIELPFPTDRYVDINTEAEWVMAEHKYSLLHGGVLIPVNQ